MKGALVLGALLGAGTALAVQTYRDPGMQKVVQVAFVCRDVETTSKRWAAVLGVAPPQIFTTRPGHEVKMVYRGKPSEGQARIAILKAGQVDLEFLQPLGDDTSWKEYLDSRGEGIQHIAFKVEDPARTTEFFKQLGMGVLHQGRFDDDDGSYTYIDSRDQLLVNVELLHDDPKK